MDELTNEKQVEQTWKEYWRNQGDKVTSWDAVSASVLGCIVREFAPLSRKRLLEAGCGTGRISRALALAGARVACLDIAPEALAIARQQIGEELAADYVLGSIIAMPRSVLYDGVWNSGVMEHFGLEQQRKALSEFDAVCGDNGKIVILCPSAHSLLYRLGKLVLERSGNWRYGVELPVRTLRDCTPDGLILEREYSVAFMPFLLDADKFLRPLGVVCRPLRRLSFTRWGAAVTNLLDRVLSRVLGGYLLVSVFRKVEANRD